MSNDYKDYVDVRMSTFEWQVGRILRREGDSYKIKLDGSKNEMKLACNSPRLAPFRKYTRGYTGNLRGTRDDPNVSIECMDQYFHQIEVFQSKDLNSFDPSMLNTNLRGRLFFFIDSLLSDPPEDLKIDEAKRCFVFLNRFLDFSVVYLQRFPEFFEHFNEGMRNLESLVSKGEIIYSHFIFELLESLTEIFGGVSRCFGLFDACAEDETAEEIFEIYPEFPRRAEVSDQKIEIENNTQEADATSNHSNSHAEKNPMRCVSLLVKKFFVNGGINALLDVIFAEDEDGSPNVEKTTELATAETSPTKRSSNTESERIIEEEKNNIPNSSSAERTTIKIEKMEIQQDGEQEEDYAKSTHYKVLCPWLLVEKILDLIGVILPHLKDEKPITSVDLKSKLQKKMFKRLKLIHDKEIRELDLDIVKLVFDKLETIMLTPVQNVNVQPDYRERERSELSLYLRLLDCHSFEKKLKGINGIREFASRINTGQHLPDDVRAMRPLLKDLTSEDFIQWILKKKVIELIYEKSPHIELIKRSLDILKFLARHCEIFPENLIHTIWNSSCDKHEDLVKCIYDNIIELGPELSIEAAQKFYENLRKVKIEEYSEEFIDLISRFTNRCLSLVVKRGDGDSLQVRDLPEELKEHQFFGVPLMFELVMDDSLLDPSSSQKVLFYLKDIINDYPIPSIFFSIVSKCLENITKDQSVYQSLVIMREFIGKLEQTPSLESFKTVYFEKLALESPLIEYLVNDICLYCEKVKLLLSVMRNEKNRDEKKDGELMMESFVGKFPHRSNINERFAALTYFIPHIYSKTLLTANQVSRLWKVFVLEPNFAFETTNFLKIISKVYVWNQKSLLLVKWDDFKEVLFDTLCNEETFVISSLTQEKFNCLEFFFLCVNLKEGKLKFDQKEESPENIITSNIMRTVQQDLIGLENIWKYFVQCPEGLLVDRFIYLIVNIHTKLDQSLKDQEQEINEKLVDFVMNEISKNLTENNIKAIERYIQFLGNFFDKLSNKKVENYKNFTSYSNSSLMHSTHFQNQLQKIPAIIDFQPYGVKKKWDFFKREKVGSVREQLARIFEVDTSEFDWSINDIFINDDDLYKELKEIYQGLPSHIKIRMIKKSANTHFDPRILIAQNREYISLFFQLFAIAKPDKAKTIWDFAQKLPLQEDIKTEFFERTDFTNIFNDEESLSNGNIYKFHYYLSIIMTLSIKDPYYLKTDHDLRAVKTDWADAFVEGSGVTSLVNLINSTDFSQIDSFLFIKALVLLSKVLKFFFLSFQQTHDLYTREFFIKNLEILLYSSQFLKTMSGDHTLQFEMIRDHAMICQNICYIIQSRLSQYLYDTFLQYDRLKELLVALYINTPLDNYETFDGQNAFKSFLYEILNIINREMAEGKENGERFFQIIFEEILFEALKSQSTCFTIFGFIEEILKLINFNRPLNCGLDIFTIMNHLVDFVKSKEQPQKYYQSLLERKIESCFKILSQYLQNNQDKLEHFGRNLGLIEEILKVGIFQIPTLDRTKGPKYTNKSLIKAAYEMLSLLSKNEKNFITITKYLSRIHKCGIWRNLKNTSWNLSANIKRRSLPYAGLKNLGCTCYMNSTLQHLFMIPTFKKYLPKLMDPNFKADEVDDNVLFQLKRVLYGLNFVDKEYYSTKQFCHSFQDFEGNPTNPREQKDAFEFLSLLMDRLEEQIKGTPSSDFMKVHFGGLLSNELICKECPHHYDREEPLLAINLPVKNKKTIIDSLGSFIEGEILDGDNAYFCEECKKKVKTVKRVSIKKLPNYLMFILKRFEYDFDMNARVKVNDYCEFPFELDMEPFTQQYLKRMERPRKSTSEGNEASNSRVLSEKVNCEYTLKGVVVHMGIADSGHYYSIIKDTKTDDEGNKKSQWLEFNDCKITEFNMSRFGDIAYGEREGHSSYQSAFILLYEKKEMNQDLRDFEQKFEQEDEKKLKFLQKLKEKRMNRMEMEETKDENICEKMEEETKGQQSEKMVEETQQKGGEDLSEEEKANRLYLKSFAEQLEFKKVEDEILRKNLRIFYVTNIFSENYSNFIWSLMKSNNKQLHNQEESESEIMIEKQAQTDVMEIEDTKEIQQNKKLKNNSDQVFNFVCLVYFTSTIRMNDYDLQSQFFEWICDRIEGDLKKSKFVLDCFTNKHFFIEMMFQCPRYEQRKFLTNLIKKAFKVIFADDIKTENFSKVNEEEIPISTSANFLNFLIGMLDYSKAYPKTFGNYFKLFLLLMELSQDIIYYLLEKQLLGRLAYYFFESSLQHEQFQNLKGGLNYVETESILEYKDDMEFELRPSSYSKFSSADLSQFFILTWELLTCARMPEVENFERFTFKRGTGFIYELTDLERQLFELNEDQIEKLLYATAEQYRARVSVCKIVAFSCFGSASRTELALDFILEELMQEKNTKKKCFTLLKTLAQLNDPFEKKRNIKIISHLLEDIKSKKDNGQQLLAAVDFLSQLIKKNEKLETIFLDKPEYSELVLSIIQDYLSSSNSEASTKPGSHLVLKNRREALNKQIMFYEGLLREEEIVKSQDTTDDEDWKVQFSKGQKVEFRGRNSAQTNEWFTGVVEGIYENILKIKSTLPNGTVCIDWVEDDWSNVNILVENNIPEINANADDNSRTQYCTSQGDISYQGSPRSVRSFEDITNPSPM